MSKATACKDLAKAAEVRLSRVSHTHFSQRPFGEFRCVRQPWPRKRLGAAPSLRASFFLRSLRAIGRRSIGRAGTRRSGPGGAGREARRRAVPGSGARASGTAGRARRRRRERCLRSGGSWRRRRCEPLSAGGDGGGGARWRDRVLRASRPPAV